MAFCDCSDDNNTGAENPALAQLEKIGRDLIVTVGENPEREGLLRTPQRFARSWEYLTSGYHVDISKLVNNAVFEEAYDEIIAVKNIEFFSMCEHHLLPFYGKCSVAYIPNGRVIGLSKIPRIVDAFSRRLQIQECLTRQIAAALNEHLSPIGVAVVMEARHMCMCMRGVEKQTSTCLTSELTGVFKRSAKSRSEVMTLFGMNLK